MYVRAAEEMLPQQDRGNCYRYRESALREYTVNSGEDLIDWIHYSCANFSTRDSDSDSMHYAQISEIEICHERIEIENRIVSEFQRQCDFVI